jgi:hypothetical protein
MTHLVFRVGGRLARAWILASLGEHFKTAEKMGMNFFCVWQVLFLSVVLCWK